MLERGSKTSTVKVSELNLDFYRREPNDFLSQMVTMDETWLYHYELEIKQQSILSEHGVSPWPAPKNSDCKITLENLPTASIFRIKTASATLITFQRAKHSTWSITHLCWCKWRTFWRKKAAEWSPSLSCSCTTIPRITGHLQPRRKWSTRESSILITNPILRFYHLFSGLKK